MRISLDKEEQKWWIDFAVYVGAFSQAIQWQKQFGSKFSENQLQRIFAWTLVDRTEISNQLFCKDITWREEEALAVFLKFNSEPRAEYVVERILDRGYELLTIKCLGCYPFHLCALIRLLKSARGKSSIFVIAFLSKAIKEKLDDPNCCEESLGEALISAICANQKEIAEEILSKKLSPKNIVSSAILAVKENGTDLVKRLWALTPFAPETQDEILYWAAKYGNEEIIGLQTIPISPEASKKALQIAEQNGHKNKLQELLRPWVAPVIEDYSP